MKQARDRRTMIIASSTPRIATRTAHMVGQQFKRGGGAYYTVSDAVLSVALTYTVWLTIIGTKTVVEAFSPHGVRIQETPHV